MQTHEASDFWGLHKNMNSAFLLKLTLKTPDRRHWHRSGVFTVNFYEI